MKNLLLRKLPAEGFVVTDIAGVGLFRRDMPYKKRPQLYHPQIILLAQGRKNIYLGDQSYVYDPQHYYVQTLPLPVECEAIIDEDKPMLGMVLKIEPQFIGEILFEMETDLPAGGRVSKSVYDAEISEEMTDAAVRLLRTLDSKDETRILGPLFLKELLFRILNGKNGGVLRDLAMNNRGFYQIARTIRKIHESYAQPIEIQSLAREAGMSSTAFYSIFKATTSASPLQYLKNVRLHKARELIQQEGEKAGAAAVKVGYESTSQFSREYKRCFGVPPAKDRQPVPAH